MVSYSPLIFKMKSRCLKGTQYLLSTAYRTALAHSEVTLSRRLFLYHKACNNLVCLSIDWCGTTFAVCFSLLPPYFKRQFCWHLSMFFWISFSCAWKEVGALYTKNELNYGWCWIRIISGHFYFFVVVCKHWGSHNLCDCFNIKRTAFVFSVHVNWCSQVFHSTELKSEKAAISWNALEKSWNKPYQPSSVLLPRWLMSLASLLSPLVSSYH